MDNSPFRLLSVVGIGLMLSACGGGGNGAAQQGSQDGSLSIQITDAPVDDILGVTVEFTGITVKPREGAALTFAFDTPLSVDLAELTEDNSASLLNEQTLPAGEYNWMRLDVNADCDAVFDSFVRVPGGDVELRVPSARGLQLGNGFVITANQNTSFLIDWDLRLGLVDPQGSSCYKLKPSLRIVDMTRYGSIAGTVDASLLSAPNCSSDPNTEAGNVVYIYDGADIVPDDIDGIEPEPVTTANVKQDSITGEFRYRAAFLTPGAYTAAFSCQGQDDMIPDDENAVLDVDDDLQFTAGMNVDVVDGATATLNFD